MNVRLFGLIAILSLSAAGGVAAQPTASERYDVNPAPLIAIAPSLRDDLPLPRLQDTPAGGPATPAPEANSSRNAGQILYDVNTQSRFTPYLGVGGPTARLGRNYNSAAATPNAGDPVQGYQGVAGLAYNLDRNVQFNLGYRYSNFQRQDTPVPEDTEVDHQTRDGRAMLLFKYELGGNNR